MDDFRTILDKLEPEAEAYVLEKAKRPNDSITAILKKINVGRAKFYSEYDADTRAELDDLARLIHRDKHFRAYLKIDGSVIEAVKTLINLMRGAKSEFVQLQSAQTLIQYALGSPTFRFEGNVKVNDWRSDAIEAIKAGEIAFAPLADELGVDLATELFEQAGVPVAG